MSYMSGYALRLQCQLDKDIKFNGLHPSERCQALISSRRLGEGSSEPNEPPGSAPDTVFGRQIFCTSGR